MRRRSRPLRRRAAPRHSVPWAGRRDEPQEVLLLKLVSISSTPADRDADRRRYETLAMLPDLDVLLVVPQRHDGPRPASPAPARAGILRVTAEPVRLRSIIGTRWHLQTYPRLGHLLRAERPDVIHVLGEPSSLVAMQAARLRDVCAPGAALVVESDSTELHYLSLPFRHIERRTLSRTDVLIARHREVLEAARASGFLGHGTLIDYGVDRAVFRPGYREEARAVFGGEGLNIGYAGRLVRENGLVEILEAVAASRAPITLLIMGAGPMRDEIADRAASLDIAARVRIVPPGPPAETARFLNALDARVMMPHAGRGVREPFHRMIAETQACGVPIVAAALPGIAEIVGDGGWTVDEGDAGMLSRLLQRLAENPAELAAASRACIARVERRFSLEMVSHELHRAFLIARQNRSLRKPRASVSETDPFALQKSLKP